MSSSGPPIDLDESVYANLKAALQEHLPGVDTIDVGQDYDGLYLVTFNRSRGPSIVRFDDTAVASLAP